MTLTIRPDLGSDSLGSRRSTPIQPIQPSACKMHAERLKMQRPQTASIRGTHGRVRETDERKKNDDNGCTTPRQDRRSPSSSFSRSSPQEPDDHADVNALAVMIGELLGWEPKDVIPRIVTERAAGFSLLAIRNTAAEMKRQWAMIRNRDWRWIYRTLRNNDPNMGPLPRANPKADRPMQDAREILPT